MNVVSLENSKRLYKISGWGSVNYEIMDTAEAYFIYDDFSNVTFPYRVKGSHNDYQSWNSKRAGDGTFIPAYDLGYLFKRLKDEIGEIAYIPQSNGSWLLLYRIFGEDENNNNIFSDTPEDAACLLAIKLFEEGILTKES